MLADSMPGSISRSRAAWRNVRIGSPAEPWHRMLSASGGLTTAWTGAISPRIVPGDQLGGAQASFAAVDVRVRLPGERDRGRRDLGRRDVAVGVHDDTDGDAVADGRADALDHRGVRIGIGLAHRRAVLRHQHAVERALLLERGDDVARHLLERLGGDGAAGRRGGEHQGHDIHAGQAVSGVEPGDRGLGARVDVPQLLSGDDAHDARLVGADGHQGKVIRAGDTRREGIGLVQQAHGGEAHQVSLSVVGRSWFTVVGGQASRHRAPRRRARR